MKKTLYIGLVFFTLLHACSTRKNNAVNRTYHKTTTKYNVLYNGKEALNKGIEQLDEEYADNYWKILPIEPLHVEEDRIDLPGKKNDNSSNPFDIAEEKAVKAVQKHSIQDGGTEYNEQIDDAYFLLGKARYYSQRFIPALEAFNYIIRHYPKGDLYRDLLLWKAKTLIRLQSEEQAIEILTKLVEDKNTNIRIKEEAYTALAMANMSLEKKPEVIRYLKKATQTNENPAQYARNLFILGQLYREEQQLDSSSLAFKKVLQWKKAPYRYYIHAYMELARNVRDTVPHEELKKTLNKLISHYENKKYLGELYYHSALLDLLDKDEKIAVEKLKKSTLAEGTSESQKSISYEALGNYYFDHSKYLKAGAYYDSLLSVDPDKLSKRFRRLKKKRKSLDEVIEYEKILQTNDSIFRLVKMDSTRRRAYFEDYVKKLKKKDEIAAIQAENAQRNATGGGQHTFDANNPMRSNRSRPGGGPSAQNQSKWYFYNAQVKGFGISEFQKLWGKRPLQDNWRWDKGSTNPTRDEKTNITVTNAPLDKSKKYDVDYYLSRIPNDQTILNGMKKENAKALYQLGMSYKEKFKAYPLAIERLERFIQENPQDKQVVPASYHLYKMLEKSDPEKAAYYKNLLVQKFPDSRFTQRILYPKQSLQPDENSPETIYEDLYCQYDFYEKYPEVIAACNSAITRFAEEPIVPKFELLKALATYKSQGKEPAKKQLEYIIGTYPKTEEAERAQELLDVLNGVKRKKKEKLEKAKIEKQKERNKSREQNQHLMPKGLPGRKEMMKRINTQRKLNGKK